jgi:glycosyltransferase involved in cell wall biosynthesis
LRPAVESVFAQTLPHWELIIGDDGSDGETLEYLRGLQHRPRVKVIRLPHSGNPCAVRNSAFGCAVGDYVAFLDSDDIWMPTKLEKQITSLRSRSDRGWSYTGFRMVDTALNSRERIPPFVVADGWILDKLLSARMTIVQSSVVVARSLLEQAGPYDESIPWCGEYELWARFATRSAVDCVGESLVLVRRHAEHGSDDVTACENFVRALDRITGSVTAPHLAAVLRERRAVAAAILARSQAVSGRRMSALATLLASAPRSWHYPEWWRRAAGTAARAATPPHVRNALRRARHRLRQQHS